jgi:threonylcarbamoyladenosine tRNA methylthiotransferase MtaB
MESKPVQQVLNEFQALLENGYQEVVLTGIRLGLYRGEDGENGRINLLSLLKRMVDLEGNFRIRLSSLEVTEVTDSLIDFVKNNNKICRHFHVPMQSGSSSVLKAMNRWYNADYYRGRVKAIRDAMPDCGVTADVMVGYPTETEDEFFETYSNIQKMELSGLHVFRFSAREGTDAHKLTPLDPRIIKERAEKLSDLDKKLRINFLERFKGQERMVLPEPTGEGWTDNYIRVQMPLPQSTQGLTLWRI